MTLPVPREPKLLEPGEGEYVVIGGKARCTFKISAEDTDGQFGLFEFVMEAEGVGATPHTHQALTEMFYVADGEVDLMAGDKKTRGGQGTILVVPPGAVHAFANVGPGPATVLVMFCPAGERERYFKGLAELTADGRVPTREELVQLMSENDQQPVDLGDWRN